MKAAVSKARKQGSLHCFAQHAHTQGSTYHRIGSLRRRTKGRTVGITLSPFLNLFDCQVLVRPFCWDRRQFPAQEEEGLLRGERPQLERRVGIFCRGRAVQKTFGDALGSETSSTFTLISTWPAC